MTLPLTSNFSFVPVGLAMDPLLGDVMFNRVVLLARGCSSLSLLSLSVFRPGYDFFASVLFSVLYKSLGACNGALGFYSLSGRRRSAIC